jgi:NhaA family Na+:H+ antiporter
MASGNRSVRGSVQVTRALREFLATEVAGGVALLLAALVAVVWANSPWSEGYHQLWETDLAVNLGQWSLRLDLRHWVTEGLMAIFFVVVGLEVKRELVEGELRDLRRAALPVVAAVGGMVVPALLYLALNAGDQGHRGWGIPMATDIAFALGVAALVGRGLPSSLRLFLLTLAIVDDIGAIVVIAFVYSEGVGWWWLGVAGVILSGAYVVRETGVVFTPLFVAFGIGIWLALHEAGVHATLAGVAMGLLAPAQPRLSREIVLSRTDELADVSTPKAARVTSRIARLSVSQTEWLEHALHPWSSLVVVPVFALANAGVPLSVDALEQAATSPITWGVAIGLVVGKVVGISAFAWLAWRVGVATLPTGATWRDVIGVAALAGIGFTVSLFVTGLAFEAEGLQDEAKVGIFAASLAATLVGAALLLRRRSREGGRAQA